MPHLHITKFNELPLVTQFQIKRLNVLNSRMAKGPIISKNLEPQERKPEIAISLRKVGVTGVKMPIGFVLFENKPVMIIPIFDVFIDLPANQKGIHASRNYEVVTEVLSEYAGKTYKLEKLCASVAKELLKRHKYATRSEVKARGEAIVERETPKTGILTYEPSAIMAKAIAEKKSNGSTSIRKTLGVSIVGITACPSVQETLKELALKEIEKRVKLPRKKIEETLRHIPLATHIQRSQGSIIMEVPEGVEIDAMRLSRIIEDSMSAPTFELLKRSDEAQLVQMAVGNPKFVEDCIRHMMKNVDVSFPELPDEITIVFSVRSHESIHKHDLVAKRTITLGELRKELLENNK
jgi:GTP cyclohydrolase-4